MPNKKRKIFFFFLSFVFFIFLANFALAVEFRPPEINYPQLPFPGVLSPQVFGEIPGEQAFLLYVKYFYYLFLMVAGFLAFGTIVYGGFLYLISAGAPVKMIAAKEQITGGILGLVILLSSYLILATINPQLVILRLPGLEKIEIEPIEIEKMEPTTPVYFQIPTGMIIERAVLNEEAQRKLDSVFQTADKIAKAANELYALSEEMHSWVKKADCGNSKCRVVDSIDCSATGCTGKDYQSDITTTIGNTAPAIEDLEKEVEKISIAKIALINDLSQLGAAGALMSLKYWEVGTYNDFSSIKNYYAGIEKEIKIDSSPFSDWENISLEINGQIIKDPVTFYLDREGNEDEIYLASAILLGGDAGLPPEPWGGWSEPPVVKPGAVNWPTIPGAEITSYFGLRCDPVELKKTGKCVWRPHNGIDIGVFYSPVYAAAAGTVVYKGSVGGYGNIIIIRHDDLKLSTAYAHLSKFYVNSGDRVIAGQPIAISGNSGYGTGPHLHFEVRIGLAEDLYSYLLLQAKNPLSFLSK